ncbi:MAG: hypothetical protein RR552_02925 [Oscillospiraceae bacterium]
MIDAIRVADMMSKLYAVKSDDLSDALSIAKSSSNEIFDKLKDVKSEKDHRIIEAAAALSFYRYTLKKIMNDDAQTSFKAGDVTSSQSPSLMLQTAAIIRDEAFIKASSLLCDIDFLFGVM